jgi:hypothetical protein
LLRVKFGTSALLLYIEPGVLGPVVSPPIIRGGL